MKVIHIISSCGMYGAEAVILNLSRTMNSGNHCSMLGVFRNSLNPNLQFHEIAAREGIESHPIPCEGRIDRSAIAKIRELVEQGDVDVVHAHGYKADIYSYLAMRGRGIPVVSTCHTWYDVDDKDYLYGLVDRFALRKFAKVVAVSEDVRQGLLKSGVRPEKVSLIRNGIDLRLYDNAKPVLKDELGWTGFPLVGFIGRMSIEKGADILLNAAALVLKKNPATKFVLIGDGPDRSSLEALVEQLGIGDSVKMPGRREDMPAVYASLDVMVSSSRREGLPMAILEGMASRRALVATAVGGVPTVVHDGETGALVEPEDPTKLAAAIVRALGDKAERERLGANARRMVEEEYSAERMTNDYLDVYTEAIVSAGKRRGASRRAPQGTLA